MVLRLYCVMPSQPIGHSAMFFDLSAIDDATANESLECMCK